MKLKEKYELLLKEYKKLKKSYEKLERLIEPEWALTLRNSSISERKKAVELAMDGILTYNKGKVTPQGKELVKALKKDFELIGLSPSVTYIRARGQDLNTIARPAPLFIHPWGQRTLLLKHKKMPFLIMVNSSIRLNESALEFIKGNEKLTELFDLEGITG